MEQAPVTEALVLLTFRADAAHVERGQVGADSLGAEPGDALERKDRHERDERREPRPATHAARADEHTRRGLHHADGCRAGAQRCGQPRHRRHRSRSRTQGLRCRRNLYRGRGCKFPERVGRLLSKETFEIAPNRGCAVIPQLLLISEELGDDGRHFVRA